jgi:hypothetical protein
MWQFHGVVLTVMATVQRNRNPRFKMWALPEGGVGSKGDQCDTWADTKFIGGPELKCGVAGLGCSEWCVYTVFNVLSYFYTSGLSPSEYSVIVLL